MVTTPTNASRRPFWAGFLLAVLTACNGGPGDVNGGMRGEGETCGTIAGLACDQGLFCKHEDGTCDVIDGAGQCMAIPLGCPDNFDPVCGCDGQTYGNECEASVAGVSLDHRGECQTP
jgi:hypothetical protein